MSTGIPQVWVNQFIMYGAASLVIAVLAPDSLKWAAVLPVAYVVVAYQTKGGG